MFDYKNVYSSTSVNNHFNSHLWMSLAEPDVFKLVFIWYYDKHAILTQADFKVDRFLPQSPVYHGSLHKTTKQEKLVKFSRSVLSKS